MSNIYEMRAIGGYLCVFRAWDNHYSIIIIASTAPLFDYYLLKKRIQARSARQHLSIIILMRSINYSARYGDLEQPLTAGQR